MNYATAKAIAAQVAPTLLVDAENPAQPHLFIVRKTATGTPFSIHLVSLDPSRYQDIAARDAVPEQPGIDTSADHPGQPFIPAQPAVVARTAAGQLAEAEQKMLTDALASATSIL